MGGGGNLPIGPGIWGFIAFFVLAIALTLLVRNMNARLRRMAYTDRERAQAAEARQPVRRRATAARTRRPSRATASPPTSSPTVAEKPPFRCRATPSVPSHPFGAEPLVCRWLRPVRVASDGQRASDRGRPVGRVS